MIEYSDPQVEVNDRGEVRLTNGRVTINISADEDTPGWWYLESPGCNQVIHTDDPDMVALFWFCRSVSRPPWVNAEIVSEAKLRIMVAGESWEIEAETPDEAQESALRFLSAFSEGMDLEARQTPSSDL